MALYSETLETMRGAVKDVKPNANPGLIDRSLNKRIQEVLKRRQWSDLVRIGAIGIPDAYHEGTVSVSFGSRVVTGSGTAWPVDDEVNTTSNKVISLPGNAYVTPADMSNIIPGSVLLFDSGFKQEAVAVTSVVGGGFIASFTKTHDPGCTIKKSSLAGLQFRTSFPFFTVMAVIDPVTLWLDNPWAAPAQVAASYQIMKAYLRVDPYATRVVHCWDPNQGIALDVDNYTMNQLLILDPQLTTSDNPTILAFMPPGPGGVMQSFLYPPQSSARQLGVVYCVTWPPLVRQMDQPPPFIDPQVFIAGARSDVLRVRVSTQDYPKDPWYDPDQANHYEEEFKRLLEIDEQADEGRNPKAIQTYRLMISGGMSSDYMRTHIGSWPSDWGQ